MSEHPSDRTIQRHVDAELSPRERWDVERHLYACPSCARAADAYGMLKGRVAALPDELEPPVDLWPAIETRLGEEPPLRLVRTGRVSSRTMRPWVLFSAIAAAATLLLGIALGRQLPRSPTVIPAVSVSGTDDSLLLASYDDPAYHAVVGELETILAERRDQFQPETIAIVEENLAIIDRAIADSRAAILADPANAHLHRHLAMNMQMKVGLLRMLTDALVADI